MCIPGSNSPSSTDSRSSDSEPVPTIASLRSLRMKRVTRPSPIRLNFVPILFPEGFPRFAVRESRPDLMEPGATLFNLMRWPEEGADRDFGAIVVVDPQGEVIWYYEADHDIGDARSLPNGNVLYLTGRGGRAVEIDMLGNVVAQWHAEGDP